MTHLRGTRSVHPRGPRPFRVMGIPPVFWQAVAFLIVVVALVYALTRLT